MSALYPTRDRNYTKATELRLEDDGRRHVYGKQNKSLLVQNAYPELLNQNHSKYYHTNDNNNSNSNHSSSSSSSHAPHVWSSIGIKKYQIIRKVGSGTYGSVFYAQSPHGRDVAIKQLSPMQNEKQLQDGFHITAIREIKILKSLHHTNIISLHDVICDKENVMSDYNEAINPNSSQSKKDKHLSRMYKDKRMQTYMIFEYMHHDLSGLLQNEAFTKLITVSTIKYFMCQILNALQYCHETALILHRDIKSSNLLVDHHGVVKIADFGLARQFIPELMTSNERIAQRHESINNRDCQYRRQYTNRVVTLWYRAPELLLSDQHYTPAVDLWSVGCVFAELLFNKPIFQGKNEMEQWFQIIGICGWDQKREQQWMSHLHDNHGLIAAMKKKSVTFNRRLDRKFKQFTKKEAMNDNKYLDENGFRLLDSLLTINPFKRCSAAKARESEWFKNHPFPEPPKLKHLQSSHDYEQRQARKNPNYKKQQQQLNHNNHLYQNKNNNMNNNNMNNNNNNNRRYQYSYGGYQNNTHSNTTNNRYNAHNPHNGTNNNYTRNNRMNDRNRSRSRSRSRERNLHKPMMVDDRSRSGSFDKHKKDNSVSLPPPMPRLPSLHGQNNSNSVAPMVVTLQAPSLNNNNNKNAYNNNTMNNNMNSNNNNIVNNNINNGYKPQWKNGYNADATFYSRFKKPDELKGRSRF